VAHAIFLLHIPIIADILIRDGLYIFQEKFFPQKDKKEPIRCVRCQGWGHIARDCHANHDTCGTCGNHHRTANCTNQNASHCANCNSNDHPSYSRNCPDFTRRCELIDAKNPENLMPYYPTDEFWTQVLLPPKKQPLQKPANLTFMPSRTAFRQTFLDFTQMQPNKPPTHQERISKNTNHPPPPRTSTLDTTTSQHALSKYPSSPHTSTTPTIHQNDNSELRPTSPSLSFHTSNSSLDLNDHLAMLNYSLSIHDGWN
jgi:hypothetical protein